ncbi:serine/threonine-protein kinase [Nonomuraea sp. SBT364]|uniref:serine/threonine-protein kinase n=1 Tax=Nonomuraea sp. SBT364 TaxID=1580530 RepID=UPI00066E0EED|nr:serine/threonine-protein kinase [Nonomuraea sp. SBT364]
MVAQGTTLAGRYRLDTRIGAGGMGEVWRGEDTVLARTVAVKVLLPGRMQDPGFLARFQGEARAMATINHPGVVDVYDYGVSGDTVYLVMKFVDGEPLDRLLGRLGRISPQPAMELIAQAASALQAVHDQGIVHRDVKPGNLLVQRDGTLVITDFGIARSDLANRLTDAGMVLGTAAYCAPEQAEGAPVTPAVDIYALGVVAYECLAGQRPFDGDSPVTIALKHIREAPPPLPPDIPAPVRALVERALSKDPARRFPSARAMSDAARMVATGEIPMTQAPMPTTGATMAPPAEAYQTGAVQSPPDATTVAGSRAGSRRAAKAPRRGGLVAGLAAALVLGVGAGAVALTNMSAESGPQISQPTPTVSISETKTEEPSTPTTKPPRSKPTVTREQPIRDRTTPTPEETEPTESPSPTPTPTPTKTKTPTPTPTPKPKKAVPEVVNLPYAQALAKIKAAGFGFKADDQTDGTLPDTCKMVGQTFPDGGEMLEMGKTVEAVLIPTPTCNTPTPTVTATTTVKP